MDDVLLIGSDRGVLDDRVRELSAEGHTVRPSHTAVGARAALASGTAQAVVLGAVGDERSTLGLLRDLRAGTIDGADRTVPVILVGADQDSQLARAFNAGADVALPGDIAPYTLAAAVQRIEHRAAQRDERGLSKIGNLTVDRARQQASVDGRPLTLTAKEFAVLAELAAKPGYFGTNAALAKSVWGDSFNRESVLRTATSRANHHLREQGATVKIASVWGTGKRLEGTRPATSQPKRGRGR